MATTMLSRRQFLARVGLGTLIIGFRLVPGLDPVLEADAQDAALTGGMGIDSWLTIDPQNRVTIFSGKVELGTGVQTALTQIVVEELFMTFDQVVYIQGDTAQTPGDKGYTAGSKTIQNQGRQLRLAAATAFQALLSLASQALQVPPEDLYAQAGAIGVGPTMENAQTYSTLIGQQVISLTTNATVVVKQPNTYQVVGQSVPRVDLPAKVRAQFTYTSDVILPSMLHGRVIRPAGRNATFAAIDPLSLQQVQAIPGMLQVVQLDNFVGVVGSTEWAASRAAQQLNVVWTPGEPLPAQDSLAATLQDPANIYQTSTEDDRGNVDTALGTAATLHDATYVTPYQMHAAMGASVAVADVRSQPDANGIQATVWSGTQGVYPLQGALAQLLGLAVTAVRVIYVEASGCYGHNGADDVAADAALLSQAVGQPVRVQWRRQDEHGWEPLTPAMVHQMAGGLDATGMVAGWKHTVFTPTHNLRPGNLAGNLLAGQARGYLPPALPDAPRNAGTRNGPVNYTFTNHRLVANHVRIFKTLDQSRLPAAPLTYTLPRPSALRSLGGFSNSFANESFMDELALAAGIDPLTFRLQNLSDPRSVAVLQAMAAQAGWTTPLPPSPEGTKTGRGIAFLRYETNGTYVALYTEVQVTLLSGEVRVTRVVVAHDCGLIINPDGLRNQIEGNILQGISRTLKEEVQFDATGVTSVIWGSTPVVPSPYAYFVLTFAEVPTIEIVLIDQPTEPAWGAGEPVIGAVPGAIGNAIFDATGVRLRTLPMTPTRVKAALRPVNVYLPRVTR